MPRTDALDRARISKALTRAGTALLLASTGCFGAPDPSSEPSDAQSIASETTRGAACEDVQLDTWFGPARTWREASDSCIAMLSDRCASLGCVADEKTIDVHGYGEKQDRTFYCQGSEQDDSGELPRYLGSCRTPTSDPELSPPVELGTTTVLCGEHFPPCRGRSHCELLHGWVGICVGGPVGLDTRP